MPMVRPAAKPKKQPMAFANMTGQPKKLRSGDPPRIDLICGRPEPSANGEIRWPTLAAAIVKNTVQPTHTAKPPKTVCTGRQQRRTRCLHYMFRVRRKA